MNEVAVIENRAPTLTAAQVKGHVQLIQQVMESVMKDKVHYGVIPGTDKPTLLKPGAEVLMSTFRIAVDPQIEDLSSADEIRYRIRCIGTHQTSGTVMGVGIGECSSNEEKYKWKKANRREFEATPEERRRIKYGYNKQERKDFEVQQIRTEPADVANTILKMAKKRALVDFTLTALAASDCFNQDLEDMDEDLRESLTEGEQQQRQVQQPRAKSEKKVEQVDPNKKLESGQLKFIRKKLGADESGEREKAVCAQFKAEKLEDIPFAEVNRVLVWIGEQSWE
jgi:hypothetical protein